jgi:alkylated DNA repair dioxygenase AlkB
VSDQLALFDKVRPEPEGLRYAADFVSPAIEQELILGIQPLPLQPFQFGDFEGKRRVASFGFRYDYDFHQLKRAEPIPAWLAEIVANVEMFGGPATRIQQVLCTEYGVGVGIGWQPRQAAFRRDIRPIAWIRLQVSVPQTLGQDLGSLQDRCRAPVDLHDDWRVATDMGTQHSRR